MMATYISRVALLILATSVAQPDEAQRLRAFGLQLYRSGDYAGALKSYRKALAMEPDNVANHAYVATACFKTDDFECSEREYKLAIQMETAKAGRKLIPMLSNLGGMYHKMERYQEALDTFISAQELDPTDENIRMNVEASLVDLHKSYMEKEIFTSSEGGDSPFWDVPHLLRGTNYTEKAEVVFKEIIETRSPKFLEPAVTLLRSALQEFPEFAISAHLLANVAYRMRWLSEQHESLGLDLNTSLVKSTNAVLQEATQLLQASLTVSGDWGTPGTNNAGECDALGDEHITCSSPGLLVAAVATHLKPELQRLMASAETLGWNMTVLGLGNEWRGLGSKVDYLNTFLEDKNDSDLVLFVDAYDVLFLASAKDIVERFHKFEAPIVMSGEVTCAPDAGLRSLYPVEQQSELFPYVNSGSYIGRVWAVKRMLQEIHRDVEMHHCVYGADPLRLDDQRWFSRFYVRHAKDKPAIIALDTHASMFHTLHDIPVDKMFLDPHVPGLLRSHISGTEPCLVHGNGNGMQGYLAISRFVEQHGWPSREALNHNGLAPP